MSQTYFALLTAVGEAKLANATALGTQLQISRMAVGDGNGNLPTPNRLQTALVNETYRADLNELKPDPANASQIIAEMVIPETEGGYWLREMGLYDVAGDLIAISNCPPSYKPQMAEGSGRTQVLRMVLVVSSTGAVQLKIDPSVVLATRDFVTTTVANELAKLDLKNSVLVATTANLAALSGLLTVDGVALTAGARVLVKDQAIAKDNGIYLAAAGSWARAADADLSAEVTPSLLVAVEQGSVNADTVWQLTSNGPIVLGTTALTFELCAAPTASPADAESGINNVRRMTPLRVHEAMRRYGLGATASSLADTTDLDALNVTGFYRAMAGALGLPPGAVTGYAIHQNRVSGGQAFQKFVADGTLREFTRVRSSGGVWSVWAEIWHTGNLIPTELAPPGALQFFARQTPPTGWLKANGAAVSRTAYAALFAAIGTFYGAGDGSTTFNLPDRRGEFLRGWDDGRGIDPGRVFGSTQRGTLYGFDTGTAAVYAAATSGSGDLASVQDDMGADPYATADYPQGRLVTLSSSSTAALPGTAGAQAGSGITRPRNVADLVCIKY